MEWALSPLDMMILKKDCMDRRLEGYTFVTDNIVDRVEMRYIKQESMGS